MAATARTSVMGPNSWAVTYTPNAVLSEIFAEIHAACIAGGWSLTDSLSSTSAVYSAPMSDLNSSYKYVRLILTSPAGLQVSVFEGWNPATHTGVNQAYESATPANYYQRVDLSTGGYFFMFVNPRWLIAYGRTTDPTGKYIYGSSTGNAWTGCIEIKKENAGETTGSYPRFAWVNGHCLAGGEQLQGAESFTSGANAEYHHFALPRMRNGDVGKAASVKCLLSNITIPFANRAGQVMSGYCSGNENVTKTVHQDENALGSYAFPKFNSPFSPSKNALTVTPYAYDLNSGVRGAFHGMKLISAGAGSAMDIIELKLDANGKASVFGSKVKHVLLSITTINMDRIAIPL